MKNVDVQKMKLVFDLDNTLLFRDEAMLECIENVFDISLSTLQRDVIQEQDEQGHSDRLFFCTWLQSYLQIPEKAVVIWSRIKNNISYFVKLNRDATEVLTGLQAKYECILLTNGGAANQQRKIIQTGLNQFFPSNNIFISEELGCKKPELKAFQLVERQFRAATHFCMIGDHWEKDILGAKNAGWYAVHYTNNSLPTSLENVARVPSLLDLTNVLNNFKG